MPPVIFKTRKQRGIAACRRRRLAKHDNVDAAEACAVVTKGFPDDAFQPVSPTRLFTVFLGDCETEARVAGAIRPEQHRKEFVAASFRFLKDSLKGGLVWQPVLRPQSAVDDLLAWGLTGSRSVFRNGGKRRLHALRRKFGPTLGASTLEHEAPGLGCHSCTETVRASPLQFAGLKCSFHLGATWLASSSRISVATVSQSASLSPTPEKAGKGTREVLFCQQNKALYDVLAHAFEAPPGCREAAPLLSGEGQISGIDCPVLLVLHELCF